MSVFREAISDGAGSVDAGYLAMYWALIGWSVSGLFILMAGMLAIWRSPNDAASFAQVGAVIQNIGIAIGAISTGFAAVVGAVGLFRAGDKPHATTISSSAQQTITTPGAAAPPAAVIPGVMPS